MADQDTKPWEDFQQQETKPWEDFGGGTAVTAPPAPAPITSDTEPPTLADIQKTLAADKAVRGPAYVPPTVDYTKHPVTAFMKGMGQVGQGIAAIPADIGARLPTSLGGTGTNTDENVQAAIEGEKPPYMQAAELPGVPKGLALAQKTVTGTLAMAPKLAGVAGAQALGVPAPVAAGAIFGFDDEGNFDPKQAAIAAALPLVGKWGGAISEGIASKLGMSNETALRLVNAGGGYTSANAVLVAQALPGWSKMTDAQKQDAVSGIMANGLLGLADLHGVKREANGKLDLTQANRIFQEAADRAAKGLEPYNQKVLARQNAAAKVLPRTAAEAAKIQPETEVQNASGKQETAEVHGSLRTQPGGGPGEVPEPQGVGGIQSQTGGGLREEGENPPTGAQPESHAVETARLSAQPASEFAGAKGSAEAAKAFGERATTQAHIDALERAESSAVQEVKGAKTVGEKALTLRKKQFFTEAIRAADDKITDTAIAQRAKTNAAQGKDERAIMENPQPVKLDDILASETGKVDVGGKPTSLTRASWNAIASEIKADPAKASEVIQKWGKQLSEAEKYKVTEPTPEAMRRGMHPQVLREGLMSIATHGDALGLDDATRREAWKAAHLEGVQTGKEAIPNAQEEKGKKEGVLSTEPAQPIATAEAGAPQEPGEGIAETVPQQALTAGPGAATRPDLVAGPDLPVNPGNPDIYGVAERVREQRAAAGQVAPVEPGKGISAPDSVEKGRALLQSGADPEKILSDFDKTKRLSADDMAVVRAKGEQLAKAARDAESQFGTDSDEYRAAWQELSDWDARTKTMQTEWHKTGQAQQGETDIDTGSFTGLQRAYSQKTGKDFTPGQASKAQATAKVVQQADAKAATAQQQLFEELDRQAVSEGAKPGSKASDPARRVWSRVRDYIKLGKDNFDDIRNKVATDLGMSVDEVTRMMSKSGNVKQLSDNVWRTQQTARRLRERARNWVTAQATPKLIRALQTIPRVLFSLKVGFHGTVALGTHAPMVAYQPPFWKMYAQNFGKMYRMVGSQAYYEHQVQDLIRKPNYITARRAGLVNDPYMYEDYTSPQTAAYFGKITGMGNRGYSVLKMLRQDMFDKHWNDLPESTKSPEVAKAIADGVNHATGVVKGRAPKGANLLLFAPRLVASRVAWLAVDPAKAGATFAHWKTATPAEKVFAINQAKEKAWVAGTMFGILALNQGILSATGSKQKVNVSDPMKSDFLKFKVGGMDVSYGNPMITMARLPIRLNALRQKGGSGKLAHLIYPDESMSSEAFKYVRTQLSPFANLAADIGFKGDYENRPLPKMPLSGPKLPMPLRLANRGEKAYTWPELTLEQVLPIPAEEAVKDVWKKGLGMSDAQVKAYGKAFAKALFMGATGARLNEDNNQPKEGPGW